MSFGLTFMSLDHIKYFLSAGHFKAKLFLLVQVFLLAAGSNANCAVTVQAPTNVTCIDTLNYTILDNITIIENIKSDLATQTNRTLILTAPSGFEFNPGVGSVVWGFPTPSGNITGATVNVTSSTITVTFSVFGVNKWDSLAILGIEVRATSFGVTGDILRIGGSGGNASISGNNAGGGVSHGHLSAKGIGSVYSVNSGNWSDSTIWSTGVVPICGDTIYIYHTVTADSDVFALNLYIENTGHLISDYSVSIGNSFVINGNGYYTHNNTTDASATIFAATENFSTTSTVKFNQWYNLNVPLGSLVSNNFGNVIMNVTGTWQQDGQYSPDRVKGTLIVSNGTVNLDDGTGMTTQLTLQDVIIRNNANIYFSSGTNRDLTLTLNNFTDSSASATKTSIAYNSVGNLKFIVNGNFFTMHNFSALEGSGSEAGNDSIIISGNMTIAGGTFNLNTNVDANLVLEVNGNTTISGNPTLVRFMDSNNGSLQFTTTNLYASGGTNNRLMGGTAAGPVSIIINNDCLITGTTTSLHFVHNTAHPTSVTVNIGRDLSVTNGNFAVARTNSTINLSVGRHISITGATATAFGQFSSNSTKDISVTVSGGLFITDGTFKEFMGKGGDILLNIVENIVINNGTFFGVDNTTAGNNGTATFSFQDFDMNGGKAHFFNSILAGGQLVQINCLNNMLINFLSSTDYVQMIGMAGTNNAVLELNIAGNLIISGNSTGAYFLSSASSGDESMNVGGNMEVNASDVWFAGDDVSRGNNHDNIITITGNLTVNGGNTRLSCRSGSSNINVTGNVDLTGGILSMKWDQGSAIMNINGYYNQTGGTFNIHSNTSLTADVSQISVYGDFSQTGGTFNFDSCSNVLHVTEHLLNIYGANYSLGGTAVLTHANNLSTNYVFGQIYFNRTGITTYNLNSSTHDIRHVKQTISSVTTLDASSSSSGLLITSVASSIAVNNNSLNINGTLDMGDKVLSARQIGGYYSRFTVNSGGRIRLSHPGGFYTGISGMPGTINGFIGANNRLNYFLDPNSTIEYYGNSTMAVTGIPNGIAVNTQHRYGKLEINFTGTPGSAWVYPESDNEVYVRTQLILTAGEFNLDNDHNNSGGGRIINIESGATITRVAGYIRSETADGTGLVKWNISSNGSYVFPFGYDNTEYIPFTYQQTSGNSGSVSIGTYRTAADNNPLPPTVTHVRDVSGNDNSANTVDRFWKLLVTGNANANMIFTYTASEGIGIILPQSQLWEPVTQSWDLPTPGQSNPTATTNITTGISGFNTWWALVTGGMPLPIELISFEAIKNNKQTDLRWTTGSEINNDYFTLERSSDGSNYDVLGIIDGAGTSSIPLNYLFTDIKPLDGRNYYRLKQTDYNGHYSYSNVRTVFFGNENSISSYPNPVSQDDQLHIHIPAKGEYLIKITDPAGKNIFELKGYFDDNSKLTFLPKEIKLCNGIYILSLTGTADYYSQKLIVY
jgi:hypothetical protein